MEWVFYTRTYLFECGVLHRLSDSRFCQNLFVDKRNSSTLSFYKLNAISELGGMEVINRKMVYAIKD